MEGKQQTLPSDEYRKVIRENAAARLRNAGAGLTPGRWAHSRRLCSRVGQGDPEVGEEPVCCRPDSAAGASWGSRASAGDAFSHDCVMGASE